MQPGAVSHRILFRLAMVAIVVLLAAGMAGIALPDGAGPAGTGPDFECPDYRPLAPTGGGVIRPVANQIELAAALKAAGPGDTINLASGRYTGINLNSRLGHRSGTAAAPVVIQASAGAHPVIDNSGTGSPSRSTAVGITELSHITVRGLEIRNGFSGAISRGSDSVVFEHNHIHHLGQVGIVTGAAETSTGLRPSSRTTIRCNLIHDSGVLEPEYGEGIYVGTGRAGAVDRTSDVIIEGNEIHTISNEAIDVKRYVTDVVIRHNLVHDVTPYYGGAITLGINKNNWGAGNYLVEHNRIWNVSSGLYYAQAIAVAHGPTVIRNNVIWNVETNQSDSWPWTATIQVHGDDNDADWAYGFGNPAATRVEISANTVIGCTQACIDGYTDPGEIRPDLVVKDNIVDRASSGQAANDSDIVVSATDLVGPMTGSADSGQGPGSGLRLRTSGSVSSTVPSPTTQPTSHTPKSKTAGAATPPTVTTLATPATATSTVTTPASGGSPAISAGSSAPTSVSTPVADRSVRSPSASTFGSPSTSTLPSVPAPPTRPSAAGPGRPTTTMDRERTADRHSSGSPVTLSRSTTSPQGSTPMAPSTSTTAPSNPARAMAATMPTMGRSPTAWLRLIDLNTLLGDVGPQPAGTGSTGSTTNGSTSLPVPEAVPPPSTAATLGATQPTRPRDEAAVALPPQRASERGAPPPEPVVTTTTTRRTPTATDLNG